MKITLLYTLFLALLLQSDQKHQEFHSAFREDFSSAQLENFRYGSTGRKAAFKWKSGKKSKSEPGTRVLSFKLHPKENPGPGKGPEIISNKLTHFGSYSTRLKVPSAKTQPDVGAVVGFFTYENDTGQGLSEVDMEWLIADPQILYIGTWTGESGQLKRVGRTINLSTGEIHTTEYREDHRELQEKLTGDLALPTEIAPIPGFDASEGFHTYGFDWHPDHIRWWMIHPVTADTVVLWDYRGERGIPQHPSRYRMNFWHTDNWAVETNPHSLEKPESRVELEVDWMEYKPLER
ncbi:glycoside hydrolase family 16 protein [Algoriphagus sp. H41]|uniref:Glycoside hydrolase family 16 protein n=1 Tax=Algoriphagus oliviformis TaxID=2811231 RepID=A0ABS3C0V2_9BACT|nr:glycoside hydrolase family 16 protein [Algoriphagus oliviformis]MBN7810254.1 glycoside hydrolase family 16 protein [Algoriphagus oliviformis]